MNRTIVSAGVELGGTFISICVGEVQYEEDKIKSVTILERHRLNT